MPVGSMFRRALAASIAVVMLAATNAPLMISADMVPASVPEPRVAGSARADDGIRLDLIPGASEARSRVREQQIGRPPHETVASTRDVTGSIALDRIGGVVPGESRITVDLRSLRSGDPARDNWAQREMLETQRFPTADFMPTEITGLPTPLPTEGEATFQMLGDLTLHGVTRPSVWEVTAQFGEQQLASQHHPEQVQQPQIGPDRRHRHQRTHQPQNTVHCRLHPVGPPKSRGFSTGTLGR